MTGIEELAAAINERAQQIYDEEGSESVNRADAKDLLRALARTLLGESLSSAFGSPGDWGYGTRLGKALAKAISSPNS